MLRGDLSAAMDTVPANVRKELMAQLEGPLMLVNGNLPSDEVVLTVSSAAPTWTGTPKGNCVLALTDRRLIFVSPYPEVISLSLRSITSARFHPKLGTRQMGGYVISLPEDKSVQLGIDMIWGPAFEARVNFACAVAKIKDLR